MVEFGLKLSDNKVAEWAHAYIDYDELKGLIAAAKKAERSRDELEARNASLAAEIKIKFANKNNDFIPTQMNPDSDSKFDDISYGDDTETQSLISFGETNSFHGGGPYSSSSQHDPLYGSTQILNKFTEKTVYNSPYEYGSLNSLHGSRNGSQSESQNGSYQNLERANNGRMRSRSNSETSLSSMSVIENVSKSVSGYLPYFERHTFEHKMKKAIKNENTAIQNFENSLYDEVSL